MAKDVAKRAGEASKDAGPAAGPAGKRRAARARRLVRAALRPEDRWAGVFGRIAGYALAVAVVTGVLLLPFFRPSMATVVYHGSCRLLDGVTMSQAYASALHVSFEVRAGALLLASTRPRLRWPRRVRPDPLLPNPVGGFSEITEPARPPRKRGPASSLPKAGDTATRSQP
jgi:hypothetical protein